MTKKAQTTTGGQSSKESISFEGFAVSLATQALMLMGEMKGPDGSELPKDLEAARQTIDLLVMLQEKTKGNLVPEEERILAEILHNLRMCYVRHTS